jgi:xylitol oxidase
LDFTPSSGDELQSEYLVPRGCAAAAIDAVRALAPLVQPVLQVSEIRSVAADELWLSPAQGRDSVAIHFTWVKDPGAVAPVVLAVERALGPYDPRPHWGKVFVTDPAELASRYERLEAMRDLVATADPEGVFRNDFLDRYLHAR